MIKRIGVLFFALLFIGSMASAPVFSAADAAPAKAQTSAEASAADAAPAKAQTMGCMRMGAGDGGCQCGEGCHCGHCKTGKGACGCKAGAMGCKCMGAGDGGCQCGEGCQCEHCKTGKGACGCKAGAMGCKRMGAGDGGCQCGQGCQCGHCMTGKGACDCKAGAMGCKCPHRACGMGGHRAGGMDASSQKPTDAGAYSRTMNSKDGGFKVTYTSDPAGVPIGSLISWQLQVLTAAGEPVKDAEITVAGDMPEHGHGLPTMPQVTKNLGDGKYLVEGIKFSMPGWWTMTFTIKSGDKTDSVTFNLQLK
jgi:hypothetical protein